MKKELEKWILQNQYTVQEYLENKMAKIQIKVPILQNYENVELTLTQKLILRKIYLNYYPKKWQIYQKNMKLK